MPIVSRIDTTKSFDIKEGEILYDALYDRGEILPHGCLAGSCGACKIIIINGKENLQAPGAIEQNTIEAIKVEFLQTRGSQSVEGKEIRLSCRAKVLGDITFQPIK